MTLDLRELADLVRKTTASVRKELPQGVILQSEVYLTLDFEGNAPAWAARFTYRHRRRSSHQTYHGPSDHTPKGALDALLDDVLKAQVIP